MISMSMCNLINPLTRTICYNGSTRGGDSALGMTGGNGMTSLGRDDDGWINCWMTGIGPM